MELLRTRHLVLNEAAAGRTLHVRRTAEPFANIEEMRRAFEDLNRALDERGRSRLSLLVDTRDAPPRNDPEFEVAFKPLRHRMLSGFRRAAVLVSTPIGKLQVERHAREDRLSVRAFADEAEAREYCERP